MTVDHHFSSCEIFVSLLADLAALRAPLLPGEERHPVSMLATGAGFTLCHGTVASGSMDRFHDIGLLMKHEDFGTPQDLLECLTTNEAYAADTPMALLDENHRYHLRRMMEVHDRVAPTRLEAAVSFALPHAPQVALDAFLRDYQHAHRICVATISRESGVEAFRTFSERCDELVDGICSIDENAAAKV